MPLFDLMEKGVMKKLNVSSGIPLRLVVRSSYVGEHFSYYELYILENILEIEIL